jgi:hypothetical protein
MGPQNLQPFLFLAFGPATYSLSPSHIPTGYVSPRPTEETRRELFRTPKSTFFSLGFEQPADIGMALTVKNLRHWGRNGGAN